MRLKKYELNPILKPNMYNIWESKYVFNPAVYYDGDIFHMLYRAQGPDMVSRFGYAVSKNGINFNRMTDTVFEPEKLDEVYGVEDPRITLINEKLFITYSAFSPASISVGIASTKNFISWERQGIILKNFEKDAVLLPEKINGKYVLFYSIKPDMYMAFSRDMINWEEPIKVLSPRKNKWDNMTVGISGTPIKTELGWLVMYNASESGIRLKYRQGMLLLDLNDPSKVLKRSKEPVLEPEKPWEIAGGVPHVTFSCSMVDVHDDYYVYYGGADSAIGLATISKKELNQYFLTNRRKK